MLDSAWKSDLFKVNSDDLFISLSLSIFLSLDVSRRSLTLRYKWKKI